MTEQLKTNHNIRVVNLTTGDNVLCMFGEVREKMIESNWISYALSLHFELGLKMKMALFQFLHPLVSFLSSRRTSSWWRTYH